MTHIRLSGTCYSNKKGVLESKPATSAGECCGMCSSYGQKCKAWTFYNGNTCNLFKQAKQKNPLQSTAIYSTQEEDSRLIGKDPGVRYQGYHAISSR